MAALAYLLLPLSGLIAYSVGPDPRVRFHGAQAVAFGAAWPLVMYACSFVSPILTQLSGVLGIACWLWLIAGTAIGRDPRLPVVGAVLSRAAGLD